jgi:3-oxoacyl-[acyl-carrier protein] reductase
MLRKRIFCAHSAAKGGLDAFMRALALELGPHGIRVNVVGPGLTETDATAGLPPQAKEGVARATPLRRVGRPEDVAGAVLMLASAHAGFVTGAYVPVSGGAVML